MFESRPNNATITVSITPTTAAPVPVGPFDLYDDPVIAATLIAGPSLSRLGHQQRTVTITMITALHHAVSHADAVGVVVMVIRTRNVRNGLGQCQIAVGRGGGGGHVCRYTTRA